MNPNFRYDITKQETLKKAEMSNRTADIISFVTLLQEARGAVIGLELGKKEEKCLKALEFVMREVSFELSTSILCNLCETHEKKI